MRILEFIDFFSLLRRINIANDFGGLVIQHYEVPTTYIKPGQVVDSILCVVNVIVYHKSNAACVCAITSDNIITEKEISSNLQSYLSNRAILAKYIVHFLRCNLEREISNI